MNIRCRLGFHDFYAIYGPLIHKANLPPNVIEMFKKEDQYVIIKRICIRSGCKKKEEYIVQISGKLQDWDVLLAAPNFVREDLKDENG